VSSYLIYLVLFRSDAMANFLTIKWSVSIGNRFWSRMIFASIKLRKVEKKDEALGQMYFATLPNHFAINPCQQQ